MEGNKLMLLEQENEQLKAENVKLRIIVKRNRKLISEFYKKLMDIQMVQNKVNKIIGVDLDSPIVTIEGKPDYPIPEFTTSGGEKVKP